MKVGPLVKLKKILPPGYDENGMIQKYWRNCRIENGTYQCGQEVDCSRAIRVALEIVPFELKRVDDKLEQFELVFLLKMRWQDPKLHSFETKITRYTPRCDPMSIVKPLQVVSGTVLRKYVNGDLLFVEQDGESYKPAVILQREDYVFMEEPDWKRYFFPAHTILNLASIEAQTQDPTMSLLWCEQEIGGFVEYRRRYHAVLQETLELKKFPLDRQLCRIRLSAEKDISEFQFVTLPGPKNLQHSPLNWCLDEALGCVTYVRHAEEKCAYDLQRSLVNTVLHLRRRGAQFFLNVILNLFLVNIIALCAFAVPITDIGDRLGILSTTLVAVTAYQTVINEDTPHVVTTCDKYGILAVIYQVLLAIETVGLSLALHMLKWYTDEEEHAQTLECFIYYDWIIGGVFGVAWVLGHVVLVCKLLKGRTSSNWKEVYYDNQEPYKPLFECYTCGGRWPFPQMTIVTHRRPALNTNSRCPYCNETRPSKIRKHYFSPGCKNFAEPYVPQARRDEFWGVPGHLRCGELQDAKDFNEEFRAAVDASGITIDHLVLE